MSCMFRFTSRTSLFIYIPCPTMHEGSAWFLNNVTAKGNFLISIAANRGGLLHSFKPSGKAPRCRRWKTRLCKSLTLDSMRRSKGTHEASQSKHTPVAAILAAEPRNKNLSFFHSFLSDASLTRCWSASGEKWQVIRLSPSANKHKHGVTWTRRKLSRMRQKLWKYMIPAGIVRFVCQPQKRPWVSWCKKLVDYMWLISRGKRLYEPLLEPLKEK